MFAKRILAKWKSPSQREAGRGKSGLEAIL